MRSLSGQIAIQKEDSTNQKGLDCHMNLLVLGLVNLRMLDLSDSDIGNDGLRFLTGKISS